MKKADLVYELERYLIPNNKYKTVSQKLEALELFKSIRKQQEEGETVSIPEEWAVS